MFFPPDCNFLESRQDSRRFSFCVDLLKYNSSNSLSEELSNVFFSLPFGFWNNKCNKNGAGKGNAGEYEVAGGGVDGVSEGGNHVGDSEGDQPVEGGADGGSYPLEGEGGGENVNPVQRSPRQLPKPPQLTLPQPNLFVNAK